MPATNKTPSDSLLLHFDGLDMPAVPDFRLERLYWENGHRHIAGVDEAGLRAEMATLPTSGVSGRRFERDGGRGGVGGAVASWSGARWRRSPCGEPATGHTPPTRTFHFELSLLNCTSSSALILFRH